MRRYQGGDNARCLWTAVSEGLRHDLIHAVSGLVFNYRMAHSSKRCKLFLLDALLELSILCYRFKDLQITSECL